MYYGVFTVFIIICYVGTYRILGANGSVRKPQENILEERKQYKVTWKVRWNSKVAYYVDDEIRSCRASIYSN